MKYQAVIFDLGGTLAHSTKWSEYTDAARKMAAVLSVPEDDYVNLWFARSAELGTGAFPSYQEYIGHICEQMHLVVPENIIELAAIIPFSVVKNDVMRPREYSIELLSYLKGKGYKTGLISDCGPELPVFWDDTPYAPFIDVTVFSCRAGMNKADPRIFQMAIERLNVKPEHCMYIADGMRNELANAKKLGMHSVQILVSDEIDDSPIREDWRGPKISSLQEILNLL